MASITYKTGDALKPQGKGPKVIMHCNNDLGGWGAGFVLAVSNRWEEPERAYYDWFKGAEFLPDDIAQISGPPELGACQLVEVEKDVYIANIIGQHGIGPNNGRYPIRYGALKQGMQKMRAMMPKGATVHCPRIGCGLAGGEWPKVEAIINEVLGDISVTVYDMPQPAKVKDKAL